MSRRSMLLAICFLAFVPCARADRMVPMPGVERIALADAIVVGRVTGIEPLDIELASKTKHRVAVVEVTETILGKKETKTLRVGFVPIDEKSLKLRRYPPISFRLYLGQNGLMFLRKHSVENIYLGTMEYDFVPLRVEGQPAPENQPHGVGPYPDELKKARHMAKLIADPKAGLQSKDAADRLATATHILARYRTPRSPTAKTEPVSAEETQLIVNALLERDWTGVPLQVSAWNAFMRLGLTEKDGWKAPAKINDLNDLRSAAQAWYREHAKTYRIQRFVLEAAK